MVMVTNKGAVLNSDINRPWRCARVREKYVVRCALRDAQYGVGRDLGEIWLGKCLKTYLRSVVTE